MQLIGETTGVFRGRPCRGKARTQQTEQSAPMLRTRRLGQYLPPRARCLSNIATHLKDFNTPTNYSHWL
eukprot:2439097-Amphidinium_carterae.1